MTMSTHQSFTLYQLQNCEVNCAAGSQATTNTSATPGHSMPDNSSLMVLLNKGCSQVAPAREEPLPIGTVLPSISVMTVPQHDHSAEEAVENCSSSLSSLPPSLHLTDCIADNEAEILANFHLLREVGVLSAPLSGSSDQQESKNQLDLVKADLSATKSAAKASRLGHNRVINWSTSTGLLSKELLVNSQLSRRMGNPQMLIEEHNALRAAGQCFKCKKTGHMAKDCPETNLFKSKKNGKPPNTNVHFIQIEEVDYADDESSNAKAVCEIAKTITRMTQTEYNWLLNSDIREESDAVVNAYPSEFGVNWYLCSLSKLWNQYQRLLIGDHGAMDTVGVDIAKLLDETFIPHPQQMGLWWTNDMPEWMDTSFDGTLQQFDVMCSGDYLSSI
ncbi:hypothetical protein FISHEDRAFT_60941 [Fistulina hepatica ATCC 64428]|uniref:CCHC-type domain-containing protein n=1 Tax=Fistulina hepatica ATCC 64428 TaxID=1128425 RepID=A0A0D7A7E2_9AGAR|nr:hypothetical protein FISHEDRAFT_60941 [Fistulina hepatica ATCC 64428]